MKVRKMKRLRILILTLCVCLIAGVAETLNMVDAYGEGEEGMTVTAHTHCICGDTNCTDTGHNKPTAWQKWEDVYNESKWGIKFENTNTMYVYLTQDVAMGHCIDVEAGETLYLCLNGHKIVRNSNDSSAFEATIVVYNDANLILCDCKGTGNITHGTTNGVKYNGRGVRVGTSSGGKATFTMYGGKISDNHVGSKGDGRDGAGVELQNADFNMYGGEISNNVVEVASNYGGGGVNAYGGGTFNMYGGTISSNEVRNNDGGGVSMVAASFNMHGGTISGNTASEYGGGIAAYNDNFTLTGGEIKNNSANKGGGVYMYSYNESHNLTVSGSASIIENTVNNSENATGGGVYLDSGKLNVSGGANISGNIISKGNLSGGTANNVYLPSDKTLNIVGELDSNAKIGVTTENTPDANGYIEIAQADNATWAVPGKFAYENDSTGIFTKTSNYTTYLVACKHNYNASVWESDESLHWHKCSNCDATDTKTAHEYNQQIVRESYMKTAATCTKKAIYYKSCVCGEAGTDTFEDGEKNAGNHTGTLGEWQFDENNHWREYNCCSVRANEAAHTWNDGKITKATSCIEKGEKTFTCNTCKKEKTEEIPALNHDLEHHAAKAATCTEIGWDAYDTCKRSGCSYTTYKEISALNHNLEHHAAKAATCTGIGWDAYDTCTRCDYTTYSEISATGHTYKSEWDSNSEKHWHECDACKDKKDEADHTWDKGVITTPATTTSEGVKTFTCEICKATKTESIAKIPSGGGVTPPKNDTITVDVTGDKTSVKITAEISGDTASIAEIGRNDIDKAGAGVDITIDLTVLPNEIAEVTVTKNSLENIYDSETDNVSIKLTETTVNMDRATLKNIIEQMKGSDLKLVVDKHQDALESMNKAQKDTLKWMKNPKLIDAYFISGGIRITDFKGGSVEIKVPYSDKKRVRAWYIDDNGKKEKVPVKYDGKTAVLTISHFSHYVIEEDSSNNVKPAHVKKTSDKVIYVRSIKYSKKTGTKITFNKVSGADGYYVYGNRCNTDKVYKFKMLATLKGNDNTVFVHKKTAKNTFYKYYIKAYRLVDGRRVTVSRSEEIHFVTDVKGYKYGNPTKVALSSKKCTLNKGKTFNLKNRVKVYSSKKVLLHTDKVRYVSSDSRIAKVNSKGRITAEKAGRCNIYAIAQNGRAAKITVTVK